MRAVAGLLLLLLLLGRSRLLLRLQQARKMEGVEEEEERRRMTRTEEALPSQPLRRPIFSRAGRRSWGGSAGCGAARFRTALRASTAWATGASGAGSCTPCSPPWCGPAQPAEDTL